MDNQPLPPEHRSSSHPVPEDTIHRLMNNPTLFDPVRTPRFPIVLSHGLYGFDARGPSTFPSLRMHYWANVLEILRTKVGAEVIVTSVPGTGSIASRAVTLNSQLSRKARGRGVNFMAHSMGGLDCRHLITHIRPRDYVPLSLISIATPHRGSPFMDWCVDNIGIGKLQAKDRIRKGEVSFDDDLDDETPLAEPVEVSGSSDTDKTENPRPALSLASLPSSITQLLLSVVDTPAYANLTTSYLNDVFNPETPDDPRVKYFSVASRVDSIGVWHPLWLPKLVLNGFEEKAREKLRQEWDGELQMDGWDPNEVKPNWAREELWGNDGLVTIQSSKWGEFLGILEGCDHWEMRGARGIDLSLDLSSVPLSLGGDWSFKDWGRFIGQWKKKEVSADTRTAQSRARDQEQADAMIKSSTDKLSAVVDWITDQVPSSLMGKPDGAERKSLGNGQPRPIEEVEAARFKVEHDALADRERKAQRRNERELAKREDLERFYISMCRKLYDEGL